MRAPAEAAADAAAARLLPLCCALACGWLEGDRRAGRSRPTRVNIRPARARR